MVPHASIHLPGCGRHSASAGMGPHYSQPNHRVPERDPPWGGSPGALGEVPLGQETARSAPSPPGPDLDHPQQCALASSTESPPFAVRGPAGVLRHDQPTEAAPLRRPTLKSASKGNDALAPERKIRLPARTTEEPKEAERRQRSTLLPVHFRTRSIEDDTLSRRRLTPAAARWRRPTWTLAVVVLSAAAEAPRSEGGVDQSRDAGEIGRPFPSPGTFEDCSRGRGARAPKATPGW
jgi:hypothetical protein